MKWEGLRLGNLLNQCIFLWGICGQECHQTPPILLLSSLVQVTYREWAESATSDVWAVLVMTCNEWAVLEKGVELMRAYDLIHFPEPKVSFYEKI